MSVIASIKANWSKGKAFFLKNMKYLRDMRTEKKKKLRDDPRLLVLSLCEMCAGKQSLFVRVPRCQRWHPMDRLAVCRHIVLLICMSVHALCHLSPSPPILPPVFPRKLQHARQTDPARH